MRLKKGFTLREICGIHVLVPESIAMINFNKVISFNNSAKYLWISLQDMDFSMEDASLLLTEKYDVSAEVAMTDANLIINQWQDTGLIE